MSSSRILIVDLPKAPVDLYAVFVAKEYLMSGVINLGSLQDAASRAGRI